jgi:hypothetical protein
MILGATLPPLLRHGIWTADRDAGIFLGRGRHWHAAYIRSYFKNRQKLTDCAAKPR